MLHADCQLLVTFFSGHDTSNFEMEKIHMGLRIVIRVIANAAV
jgi:hypothetical protein